MEKQNQEEEKIRKPKLNLESEIPIKNQTENENEKENQLTGTTLKNLTLLETLEEYDVKMKRRGELVLKIVHKFFLSQTEATVEQDKNNQNSEGLESAMSKALRNPLVIKNIIGHLGWSSILACRLLNKLWLTLCTELLSQSRDEDLNVDCFRLCFRYCDETGTFIKDWDGLLRGEIKTLDSFNDYLSQLDPAARSAFPCKNFEFKELVLNPYQIKRFFRIQGAEIKGLRLEFCRMDRRNSVNAASLTDLLMSFCPNVECLSIPKIPFDMQTNTIAENPNPSHILNINNSDSANENEAGAGTPTSVSNLPPFSLAHLKCLLIDLFYVEKVHEILLQDIVLSSPALKQVQVKERTFANDNCNFDYLTSISKAHLVRQVVLRPEVKHLQSLKTFAQSRPPPQLSDLCLYLDSVDCTEGAEVERSISFENFLSFTSVLLNSSKKSLEGLYILRARGGQVTRLLKDEGIPTLENVRHVGLSCKESQIGIGTGTGTGWTNPLPVTEFNRIFPNARQLLIAGESETNGLILNPANLDGEMSGKNENEIETGTGVVPQITRLLVHDALTKDFWLHLPSVFCNLRELYVYNENLLPILPLIWKLGSSGLRLKVLDLKIPVKIHDLPLDQLSPAFIFPGLDAALTGFPEEACLQLLSMYPKILDEEIVEEIRINSSILDLKHLEELTIKFWIPSNDDLPQNILTVVSGAYAFERMKQEQQLKVFIKTELYPGYEQTTSFLLAKNKRMEKILNPLKPFADISYTLDQF